MGYTHYWTPVPLAKGEIKKVVKDLKAVIKATDVPLADGMGEIPAGWQIDDTHVNFNGYGSEAHETFHIAWDATAWSFCKTARKPYDKVVVACLMIIDKHVAAFSWSSDGDDEPDYQDEAKVLLVKAGVKL